MANWFVVRGGNEQGPIATQRLKELASAGQISPSDLIRREDMPTAVPAAKVRGLFLDPPSPIAPPASTPQPASAPPPPAPKPSASSNVALKVVLILAAVLGGSFLLLCGGMLLLGVGIHASIQRDFAQADKLWDEGKKAEAAEQYRRLARSAVSANAVRAYSRLIDYEMDQGNTDAAKRLIDEALQKDVTPAPTNAEAEGFVAEISAQRQEMLATLKAEEANVQAMLVEEKDRQRTLESGTPREQLEAMYIREFTTAFTLSHDYANNEVAADEAYKDKYIFITGRVGQVEKNGSKVDVRLVDFRDLFMIYCTLSRSAARSDDVKRLKYNQWVRLRGYCEGADHVDRIRLTDCDFVLITD